MEESDYKRVQTIRQFTSFETAFIMVMNTKLIALSPWLWITLSSGKDVL